MNTVPVRPMDAIKAVPAANTASWVVQSSQIATAPHSLAFAW
jgi:hypothetical protein